MNILRKWFVLCWNIRGLNSKTKQLALRNVINDCGCDVICLQETKKESFDMAFIKSCCPPCFDDYLYIPSNGASSGIIVIWKSSIFSGMMMRCEPFAMSVHFTSTTSAQSWTLINIYGPCRNDFIKWMFDLNIPSDEDWLIVGDFNFIRSAANRNKPGGKYRRYDNIQ
jgi:exonuclease III